MARAPAAYRPLVLTEPEPRAINVPLGPPRDPVIAEWFGQYATTAAGVNITPDNCRKVAEVDACVGLIEDTIATVPLDFYEKIDADHRQLRDDNALHLLLHDRPNGWQTSAEFRQMLEGWRQTHSNAYARIVSTVRGPSALEPMHPSEIKPFRFGDSVAYRWSPIDGSAPRTLLQGEVLHLRDGPPRRWNIVEAESRVERHKEDIGLLQACGEYLARFFSNNAAPKTAIKIPTTISDEASGKLREAWERRHRGLENQHRLAILDGGMDLVPIGMTNTDAQIIETRAMALASVARVFGVPLHLIGETDKSTSWGTGIEQQSIGFISYYMRPKFVVWEQALNRALMSQQMSRRFYFEFNIDGLLRGDFKTRMEGYALTMQWGISTANEIRKQMNLPPLPGGDERLFPLNMAPASRIMDVLLRTAPGQTQRELADQATRTLIELLAANAVRQPGERLNGH